MFPSIPGPELVAAVEHAERVGLDEIWLGDEGVARDPLAVLAAAAVATERIRLCVGITSPRLRHPGVLGASAATIDELSDGRFVLGLGTGGAMALEPLGLKSEHPVAEMRAAIDTVAGVLAGRDGGSFRRPPHAVEARPVELWVGARGPKLVELAAERADGLFLSGCTPEQHRTTIERARAVNAGLEVALYQSASDQPDATAASWNDVGARLSSELSEHRPAAIGINLVDNNDGSADLRQLIERAAETLAST